jgi:hypothetical protein
MKLIWTLVCSVLILAADARGQLTDAGTAKLTPKHPSKFTFPGGQLNQFVEEIKASFGVDLKAIGTVPERMLYEVHVPKMRMGGEGQKLDFRNILYLYNSVSEKGDPSLGRWVIEGPIDAEPQLIMLVPSGAKGGETFAVRAFALPASTEEEGKKIYEQLLEMVEVQRREIGDLIESGQGGGRRIADLQGKMKFHEKAGIVVATGGQTYVELALTIVEAMEQKNATADLPISKSRERTENAPK